MNTAPTENITLDIDPPEPLLATPEDYGVFGDILVDSEVHQIDADPALAWICEQWEGEPEEGCESGSWQQWYAARLDSEGNVVERKRTTVEEAIETEMAIYRLRAEEKTRIEKLLKEAA